MWNNYCNWILLMLTHGIVEISARSCPPNWTLIGLSCYLSVKYTNPPAVDRTRSSAQNYCQQFGEESGRNASLVSINDALEDQTVNLIRRLSGIDDDCYFWIGLAYHETESKILWEDGTEPGYANWAPGEPATVDVNINANVDDKEYFVVSSGSQGWKDVTNVWTALVNDMHQPAGFVCERASDPPPVTAPDDQMQEAMAEQTPNTDDAGSDDTSAEPNPGDDSDDTSNDNDEQNGDTTSNDARMGTMVGLQGPPGEIGSKGDMGETGDPGPQGLIGLPGTRGPAGRPRLKGEPGQDGIKGDTGDPGPAGPAGADGNQGEKGSKGDTGDIGPVGPSGSDGQPGSRGPPGLKGEPGPVGPQGPTGIPGPPGLSQNAAMMTIMNNTAPPRSVPYFVNATAFCNGRPPGAYPHPLHCWQFVACGFIFGGDSEMTCYAGRSFSAIGNPQCRKDNSCIWGAPSERNIAWAAAQVRKDGPVYDQDLYRLKKVVMYNAGGLLIVALVVMALCAAVGKNYCQSNRLCTKKHATSSVCSDFTYMSGQV